MESHQQSPDGDVTVLLPLWSDGNEQALERPGSERAAVRMRVPSLISDSARNGWLALHQEVQW